MKRVTVTLPDALERDLAAYLAEHEAPPSTTTVLQVALREFLEAHRLRERMYRPGRARPDLPVAEQGSDKGDLSTEHDRYAAEL